MKINPVAVGAAVVLVGAGGYYFYTQQQKKAGSGDTPAIDPTPGPSPGPVKPVEPVSNSLPDWNTFTDGKPFPWAATMGANQDTTAKQDYLIRLVQRVLIDKGFLQSPDADGSTTGVFGTQTAKALRDYKVAQGISANTPGLDQIGSATLNGLFGNSYANYQAVVTKLKNTEGISKPAGLGLVLNYPNGNKIGRWMDKKNLYRTDKVGAKGIKAREREQFLVSRSIAMKNARRKGLGCACGMSGVEDSGFGVQAYTDASIYNESGQLLGVAPASAVLGNSLGEQRGWVKFVDVNGNINFVPKSQIQYV